MDKKKNTRSKQGETCIKKTGEPPLKYIQGFSQMYHM